MCQLFLQVGMFAPEHGCNDICISIGIVRDNDVPKEEKRMLTCHYTTSNDCLCIHVQQMVAIAIIITLTLLLLYTQASI